MEMAIEGHRDDAQACRASRILRQPMHKITRIVHERAVTRPLVSPCERKKVEMLFASLKRILRLDRLRLYVPSGAHDAFHLAAAT